MTSQVARRDGREGQGRGGAQRAAYAPERASLTGRRLLLPLRDLLLILPR